jgi:phosphomannomutase
LENLIQKSSESSYKILMAQTYFKLNDQASSAKIMLELLKDSNKLEREDLEFYLVNLFATSVNKSFDESVINKYRNIVKEKYTK